MEKDAQLFPTDSEFCELYYKAINAIMGTNNEFDFTMYGCLNRFSDILYPYINSYCEFHTTNKIDEDEMAYLKDCLFYRMAYVYRNGTLLSSASAFHFRNLVDENPNCREHLLRQPLIRICSIGGGAASDVLGIVRVLETMHSSPKDLDIRVTVLDVDGSWQSTCYSVLGCLERFSDLVKVRFVQVELSTPFYSGEVVSAIQNAHVVTAVKFVSEFTRMATVVQEVMEGINELLAPGCLFFILDYSYSTLLRGCGGQPGNMTDSHLVYEELSALHVLDIPAIETNFRLFYRITTHLFNTCIKLFARGFLKGSSQDTFERFRGASRTKFSAVEMARIASWLTDRLGKETVTSYIVDTTSTEQLNYLFSELAAIEDVCRADRRVLFDRFKEHGTIDNLEWNEYIASKKELALVQKSILYKLTPMSRELWKFIEFMK